MIINATKVGARALPRFLGYPVSLHHLSIVFFLLLLLLLFFNSIPSILIVYVDRLLFPRWPIDNKRIE